MSHRSYVVGLPVVVTVHDDGTVDYEVDASEATGKNGIPEFHAASEDSNWTDHRMLLDCAIVDAERVIHDAVAVTLPRRTIISMRCPVLYLCEFRTNDLDVMSTHIKEHSS